MVGTGESWVGAWVGTEWQGVGSCWPPTWITSTPCYHERSDTQTTNHRTAMPHMPFSSKGRYSSRGLNAERKSRHKSMLPRRTKRPTSFCQWFLSLKTHVALSLRKTERKSLVSQPLSKLWTSIFYWNDLCPPPVPVLVHYAVRKWFLHTPVTCSHCWQNISAWISI